MSKIGIIGIVIAAVIAGFSGGWAYQMLMPTTASKTSSVATNQSTATPTTTASAQSQEDCLTEVWGADKYAAIVANPNLATDSDNLAALKCY